MNSPMPAKSMILSTDASIWRLDIPRIEALR